jgi:hypothetical protein
MAAGSTHDEMLRRLASAMDAPLTAPGSEILAHDVLEQFTNILPELMKKFGDKMLETLSDDERHDTVAVDPSHSVAIWFVVWPSSYVEVQVERIGKYFDDFAGIARFLMQSGLPLEALLQIDVYVTADQPISARAKAERDLDVNVEYSFAPAELFGGTRPARPRWRTVLLNIGLLTQAEKVALESFAK